MNEKKHFWGGVITGVLSASLIVCAVYLGNIVYSMHFSKAVAVGMEAGAQEVSSSVLTEDALQKIEVLQDTIDYYYWKDADTEALTEGLYSGLIDALNDPYSVYYTAEEVEDLQNKMQGVYYGIGAYISMDINVNLPKISGIIENTPAEEGGLLTDDYIYAVDGVDVYGMDLQQVVSLVRGPEGTTVTLTLARQGVLELFDLELERRKFDTVTVNYTMLDNDIAYIQIREFDDITVDQFREAYVMAKGNHMKAMILDLRDNLGGNLSAVNDIARMLLPKGLIVYTEDKNGNREEYECKGNEELEVPLVVLVNGNSASASEVLAGAIKDYEKGVLMGTTTFGKGIVQRIISLSDGSAVKLTVSSYFTPNGNNIHGIGIEPDVEVEFDVEAYLESGTDNQLENAIAFLEDELSEE